MKSLLLVLCLVADRCYAGLTPVCDVERASFNGCYGDASTGNVAVSAHGDGTCVCISNCGVPPEGSCQPSGSLGVMVQGSNVTAYVPHGAWSTGNRDIGVVNIEGASITPTRLDTLPDTINSCACNPTTGITVCSANSNKVYILSGTSILMVLTSAANATMPCKYTHFPFLVSWLVGCAHTFFGGGHLFCLSL